MKDSHRRPSEQRLQFHGYMGRSRVWTEADFEALKSALIRRASDDQKGSPSSSAPVGFTSTALCTPTDAKLAFERVLAFKPRQKIGSGRKKNATGSKRRSAANLKASTSRVLRFQSRRKNT